MVQKLLYRLWYGGGVHPFSYVKSTLLLTLILDGVSYLSLGPCRRVETNLGICTKNY